MKGPHRANLKNDRYWIKLVKKGIFTVSKKGIVTRAKTGYTDWAINSNYQKVTYRIKSVPNVSKGRPKAHSDLKVKRMQKLKRKGWTNIALAEKFNMHVSTVSKLIHGHKW